MEFMIQPDESETFPGIWVVNCPMCEVIRCGISSQDAAEACMEHLACLHEPEIAQIDQEGGGCECEA